MAPKLVPIIFVRACVSVCVCVCVCVCRGGREGAGYVHDANKEKKPRKSNTKSPHEESENHKNIRFQMQCSDIVILAKKQEVKSNCRVWNLFQKY